MSGKNTGNITIFEAEYFELYSDKNGKFWLWNKKLEQNHAWKEKTEIDAYRSSIGSLIFLVDLIKTERDELRVKLSKIEDCFSDIFPACGD